MGWDCGIAVWMVLLVGVCILVEIVEIAQPTVLRAHIRSKTKFYI